MSYSVKLFIKQTPHGLKLSTTDDFDPKEEGQIFVTDVDMTDEGVRLGLYMTLDGVLMGVDELNIDQSEDDDFIERMNKEERQYMISTFNWKE